MVRFNMAVVVLTLLVLAAVAQGVSIAANGGRPFATTLTGAAEVTGGGVPNQGDPDGIGTAEITLNPGTGQVCWAIQVSGITLPAIGAHIHVGTVTEVGPVVVPLSPPDATGGSGGCTTADRDLVKAILKEPSNYYVNVHTTDYPAGALRGQLG